MPGLLASQDEWILLVVVPCLTTLPVERECVGEASIAGPPSTAEKKKEEDACLLLHQLAIHVRAYVRYVGRSLTVVVAL
jgi:hypothetical protein